MSTAIDLCSLAWGEQDGYVVLSVRDQTKSKENPAYWNDYTFRWPRDRGKVEKLLDRAKSAERDVYWAPAVFQAPRRQADAVGSVRTLWADLDNVDPRKLPDDLKPTAYWRTSPGNYQAIWVLDRELPPKVQAELNQRLTYAIGADKGGWDLPQVLRTPETRNHKYEDVVVGKPRINGRQHIDPLKLMALPSAGVGEAEMPADVKLEPAARVLKRHKVKARAKQLLKARAENATVGIRSERLWELDCLLAESGMTASEIVSVTRESAWNKFKGRADEVKRLATEAAKAIRHVGKPEPTDEEGTVLEDRLIAPDDDDEEERNQPLPWAEFDQDHKPIRWLVAEVWGESEVGFISGLPKTYKSWIALDLAVSVATGTRFLGSFASRRANVLLIQEEDPKSVTQDRLVKIASTRDLVGATRLSRNRIEMKYDLPDNLFVLSNQGFLVTDEDWMDALGEWVIQHNIKLVILDPLMMIVEGVDEFKSFEFMTQVLKPLKKLRSRTQASVCIVHHHTKQSAETGARAMYGAVALWAWEEAAIHLSIPSPGRVTAERFSKQNKLSPLTLEIGDVSQAWKPTVMIGVGERDLYELMGTYEDGGTVDEFADVTHMSKDAVLRQLKHLEEQGKVKRTRAAPEPGRMGRRPSVWRLA